MIHGLEMEAKRLVARRFCVPYSPAGAGGFFFPRCDRLIADREPLRNCYRSVAHGAFFHRGHKVEYVAVRLARETMERVLGQIDVEAALSLTLVDRAAPGELIILLS